MEHAQWSAIPHEPVLPLRQLSLQICSIQEQARFLQAIKIHTADLAPSLPLCLQRDCQPLNLQGVSGKKIREGCKWGLQTSEALSIASPAELKPFQNEEAPDRKD